MNRMTRRLDCARRDSMSCILRLHIGLEVLLLSNRAQSRFFYEKRRDE